MTDPNGLRLESTPYLYRVGGKLHRAINIQFPLNFSVPIRTRVTAGSEILEADGHAIIGRARVMGPTQFDQPLSVQVNVQSSAGSWVGEITLPPTRAWTVYIAQDKHLDYGWIHPVEKVVERINNLTDYYLDANKKTGLRWNFDTSIWIEEYLSARSEPRRKQLIDMLQSGAFEAAALWLVPLAGIMGTEELIRSLYYGRNLQEKLGIQIRTASLQEVPSLPWGLATILAEAGIPFMVKGAYDLRNPHLKERPATPLAYWEGPDGSRVMMKWDAYQDTSLWGGYGEAYKLWRSTTTEERMEFIHNTVDRYNGYTDYPANAILLAGTGFDEYPQTTVITDFIRWFNSQGWEYPHLVDATWNDFWQDVTKQVEKNHLSIPVTRGDWGITWEEWPAQIAYINNIYRKARETILSAQGIAALVYHLDPITHTGRHTALDSAWQNLLKFNEHDFGGISPAMADDTRDTKTAYAMSARREGSRALESGLAVLANQLDKTASDGRLLVVANPNNWRSTGWVEVVVPEPGIYQVTEADAQQIIPCQLATRGAWAEHYLSFIARDIPAFGYRSYKVVQTSSALVPPEPEQAGFTFENQFYHMEIDPVSGGIKSWWSKEAQRELLDKSTGYALNQYLHFAEGQLFTTQLVSTRQRQGTVFSSLIVEAICQQTKIRSTYTLYDSINRVDILNEVIKEPSQELQCSWFAFGFEVPDRQYTYDGPATIMHPGLQALGGDCLPGAGLAFTAAQTFLAVSNPEITLFLATPDAYLFQCGEQALHDPTLDSNWKSPLALSAVMHNLTRNDFAVKQGGQSAFSFRYSLCMDSVPFSSSKAVKFAKGIAQPLSSAWVTGGSDAQLKAQTDSFLSVLPDNVIVTGFKVAEDGEGYILRLWECEGKETEAVIDFNRMGVTQAWRCDLLEGKKGKLKVEEGKVRLSIPAWGLKAMKFA